ncbi:MAG: type 4a pilus biogenesis protein PilO [Schwartzia sp.]|nr:type 4a pilus biogenesis protein PilO [Schwartzia sp. (in: firmicutes)]
MKAEQARMRFCATAFLALVLGAAFYFLLYLPQSAELRAKEAEASTLRGEIARAAAFRRMHPDPAKEAKTLGARKTLADRFLPARLDLNTFLSEAQRQATDAGVVLSALEPGEAEAADGLVRASVRLSVRGDYFAWLDFLYAMEQQGRFVKIDAVRGKADEDGAFSGTIALWVYARGQ